MYVYGTKIKIKSAKTKINDAKYNESMARLTRHTLTADSHATQLSPQAQLQSASELRQATGLRRRGARGCSCVTCGSGDT